jgi:head-tail adaptor
MIGRMDQRARMQRPTVTRDATGAALMQWVDYGERWVEEMGPVGRERWTGGQVVAERTTVLRTWWHRDFAHGQTWRLLIGDRTLQVDDVRADPPGRPIWAVFVCHEVVT